MPTRQKIVKLPSPIEVNGRIARFQMTTSHFELDIPTNTEILIERHTLWMFGKTKQRLREQYAEQRAGRIEQRDRELARAAEEVAELDGVITDIDNS